MHRSTILLRICTYACDSMQKKHAKVNSFITINCVNDFEFYL